jgi:hypothetical protein
MRWRAKRASSRSCASGGDHRRYASVARFFNTAQFWLNLQSNYNVQCGGRGGSGDCAYPALRDVSASITGLTLAAQNGFAASAPATLAERF